MGRARDRPWLKLFIERGPFSNKTIFFSVFVLLMVPFITTYSIFLIAAGIALGIIFYIIFKRAMAVAGLGVLGVITGSALQPLPNPAGVIGYYIGHIGLGVFIAGLTIFLFKLALELVKNKEIAPYIQK